MVSIIIPHLDRAALLEDALASVRAQTAADWEIVVVDDGSRPEEWAEARRREEPGRIRVIRRDGGRKGPSACRNTGLAHAQGDHVVFLDSDDLLAPWCLEERVAAFRREPDADLHVFPVLLFTDTPGDSGLLWNDMGASGDLGRFLGSDPPWCVTSPLWRREALTRLGGFNERLAYGDDADLHARAILAGCSCRKHADAMPDGFIRRGTAGRMTRGLTAEVVASRLVRLDELQRLIAAHRLPRPTQDIWPAECFTEAEFLLFNAPEPARAIRAVLDLWNGRMPWPPRWRRTIPLYFHLGALFRRRLYLGLRLLRRLAMTLLPPPFFHRTGTFQSMRLPAGTMASLRERIQRCSRFGS